MRVLQIINSLELGGAENIVCHITPEFNKRGIKTDVFVFYYKGELLNKAVDENVSIVKPPSSSLIVNFLYLIRHIRKERYDVVHTHLGISNYLGRLAAILAGTPKIVMHEHGGLLNKNFFKRVLSRALHLFTDHICYVSKHDLKYFSDLDLIKNSSKGILLNNPSLYSIVSLPKRNGVNKIGMIGRLINLKGHIYALEAFNKLKKEDYSFEYVLYGDGENEVEVQLKSYAETHNLNFRIIKGESDLSEHYKDIDIIVHPSVSEGFGLVIVEAMSFGIPVVASDVGGIPDIIKDNYNGLLSKPRDPESIYSKIKELIISKDLRDRISDNALQTVAEKYSLDNYVTRLITLYES